MLSPEFKELIRDAVALHEKPKWDNDESRRWDIIDDSDTWVDIARAALALDAENQRLRKALAEPLVVDMELPHGIREKFEAALGSLPLAGDAPSVATQPNESQPA